MNRDIITQKIVTIQTDIEKLKKLNILSVTDLDDFMKFHSVERIIEKIVDAAIDINQHILREYFKKKVSTGKESFLELRGEKILPPDFAESISKSVGLRNTIIHEYQKLDVNILFNSIPKAIEEYGKYCNYIIKWLK